MKPCVTVNISDLHFGAPRLDPLRQADNLREYLFPEIVKSQMLTITGDVYHKPLMVNSLAADTTTAFILDMLTVADQHNVTVRAVRGTYSHDLDQMRHIATLHKHNKFKNDFKYYDTVTCEYIERFDMKCIFLPDDLPYDTSDTCIEEIKKMMDGRGWLNVDYVFGHGMFDHAMPDNIKKSERNYRIEQFTPFVKKRVVFGHVHDFSARSIQVYGGSPERWSFGEEGPKGFIVIEDTGDASKVRFVENKGTIPFLTVDMTKLKSLNSEDAVAEVIKKTEELFGPKPDGYLRIIHPDAVFRQVFATVLRGRYPNLTVATMKTKDTGQHESVKSANIHQMETLPNPTKENLPDMIVSFIRDKNLANWDMTKVLSRLGELDE